ncbi:MAG: hypothetical protein AAB225_02025, partial [Acidobacteriota bacterium]
TRALMARWGRTTDIEYVYKAYLGPDGKLARATIQTRDHKEVEFRGRREGAHPLLFVVTRNNMVSGRGRSPVRHQPAPSLVDLTRRAREQVMDEVPLSYRVMVQELKREGKLRAFGTVDGEKISDPRNYLYVEARVENRDSALAVLVRLHGEDLWRSSNLGRLDYAIPRSGAVRTTIELPPGTKPSQIAELGFQCLAWPTQKEGRQVWPGSGLCRVECVPRVFLLDAECRSGSDVAAPAPADIPAGQVLVWRPK